MFEGLKRFLGFKPNEDKLFVKEMVWGDENKNGWFIVNADGSPYAGPYSRRQDALGQLTRLRQSYTPASRRVK